MIAIGVVLDTPATFWTREPFRIQLVPDARFRTPAEEEFETLTWSSVGDAPFEMTQPPSAYPQ